MARKREEEKKEKKERKAWKPPTLKSQQLYERNALACGKFQGTRQCFARFQNS